MTSSQTGPGLWSRTIARVARWFAGMPAFKFDFNDGPCVEIVGRSPALRVVMRAGNDVIHEQWIEGDHWTRANTKFAVDWHIDVLTEKGAMLFHHRFNLTGKRVRINIDSKSLGDTLAWVPQIERYAESHPDSEVFISHFWPSLFNLERTHNLTYLNPEQSLDNCYATYNIGYYFDNSQWHHPHDPRTSPLAKIAADIIGLEYHERRPLLATVPPTNNTGARPVVCIATASTAECKHWLFPGGWQAVVDHLDRSGFDCMIVQKEESSLGNVIDMSGDHPIETRIAQITACVFFVGLGSGLSWLAWALGKPVVLISGFSEPYTEFEQGCYRVINRDVCHGCWNDTSHRFDRGDWFWCPRHKCTERALECSRSITPQSVTAAISQLIQDHRIAPG